MYCGEDSLEFQQYDVKEGLGAEMGRVRRVLVVDDNILTCVQLQLEHGHKHFNLSQKPDDV